MILIPQYRTARRASGLGLLSNLILSLDLEEASGNAIDSSGNSYTFTDTNTVTQTTGATAGYNSRQFTAANSEYFTRAHSTTELTIGDNEWAMHCWYYHDGSTNRSILCKSGSTTISTTASRSFAILGNSTALSFRVGEAVAANGDSVANDAGALSTNSWHSVLCWHDPAADVIGVKVNSRSAVTAAHAGGVRDGTAAVTVGSALTNNYCNGNIAALRVWRGSGVIEQIVNNASAVSFLSGQQRRHSELT